MLDATRLRVLVAIARHGSVTAAAQALNYAQPSISHHMARLEAETGAKLMERSGRGVRLTEAGQLLAERAQEILVRLDAAEAELAAHVGLRAGRVRVAAFGSALGTLVAAAGASLRAARSVPGPVPGRADGGDRATVLAPRRTQTGRGSVDMVVTQAEPAEALRLLKIGEADVAVVFRYTGQGAGDPAEPGCWPDGDFAADGLRVRCLLDETVYLLTPTAVPRARAATDAEQHTDGTARAGGSAPVLSDYAGGRWIAGCEHCSAVLVRLCAQAGFSPDIAVSTDDYHAVQALVAAGFGTAVLPGLAVRPARHPDVVATELPGTRRQVLAATYGTATGGSASSHLIEALAQAAAGPGELGQMAVARPAQ